MGLSVKIQGGIILIWLCLLSAGVSSYKNECWNFLCVTDASLNCTCKPEVPTWLVPTICLVPLAILGSCCIRMCIYYYKERDVIRLPDGSTLPTPPPLPVPDVISIHNFQLRIPPSYDEAVGKEPCYPCHLDDPPAYEEISMHCVSPSDVHVVPIFMPKNETSTV